MITLQGITKSFGSLQVLKGIDLTIDKGEMVSIVGPSGAGKTTLLQIVGTLDHPDAGSVCVEGIETEGMKAILQQYNIQSFQGYFYGKPLEIRDFLLWDHEQLEKKKAWADRHKKFDSIDSVDITDDDMARIKKAEIPEGF